MIRFLASLSGTVTLLAMGLATLPCSAASTVGEFTFASETKRPDLTAEAKEITGQGKHGAGNMSA